MILLITIILAIILDMFSLFLLLPFIAKTFFWDEAPDEVKEMVKHTHYQIQQYLIFGLALLATFTALYLALKG